MHREGGWEEQLRGTLRLRKGEKTSLAWLRGVSDKTWRGKLAFPAHLMCALQSMDTFTHVNPQPPLNLTQ